MRTRNDISYTPISKSEGAGCAGVGCGCVFISLISLALWALKIAVIVLIIAAVLHWLGIVTVPMFALAALA